MTSDKISELGIEEFTRIIVRKLEELNNEIVLQNPQEKDIFPCGVVSNVMRKNLILENSIPVESTFSVTVEWWSDKHYTSMKLFDEASKKLRELNVLLNTNTTSRYDDITRKYVVGGNYRVNYNGITNSFQIIR